jgi:hypothetical protein
MRKPIRMDIAAYIVAGLGGLIVAFAGLHGFANKSITIISFGAGAILLIVGGCLYWQDAIWKRDSRVPSFKISTETWISMPRETDRSGVWWLLYDQATFKQQPVLCPITDMMYVRLTNESEHPMMIAHYSVEVCFEGREWQPATRMDTTGTRLFLVGSDEGFANPAEFGFGEPTLEQAVVDKNIGPKESIRGMVIIERPEGGGYPDFKPKWRFTITDADGAKAKSVLTLGAFKGDQTFVVTKLKVIKREHPDLTQIERSYYSERRKVPNK